MHERRFCRGSGVLERWNGIAGPWSEGWPRVAVTPKEERFIG